MTLSRIMVRRITPRRKPPDNASSYTPSTQSGHIIGKRDSKAAKYDIATVTRYFAWPGPGEEIMLSTFEDPMRSMISAIVMVALLAAEGGAQQNPPLDQQVSTNPAHASTPVAADALVLHKGTPVCLLVTETVSSTTAKAGDHVTFRVDNDLSAQGLTVVSPGTKIDATLRKVQRPRSWVLDAGLGFSLDTLRLVDGQTVALKPRKTHGDSIWSDDETSFWMVALAPITVPWMATQKGDETSQGPGMCLPAETAQDITLDKRKVESLQPQGSIAGEANWKTQLQQMLPPSLALNTSVPEPEQGEEIEELDLTSGQERRLDKCKHCVSPVAYP